MGCRSGTHSSMWFVWPRKKPGDQTNSFFFFAIIRSNVTTAFRTIEIWSTFGEYQSKGERTWVDRKSQVISSRNCPTSFAWLHRFSGAAKRPLS